MAVNKNFVVKNGLEVNTDLIVADTDSGMVGVGTTIPTYLLHAYQGTGIGASSVYVTGISTVAQEFNVGLGGSVFTVLGNAEGTAGIGQSVGVGTGEPAYLLDVRAPVSTGQTALYVQGDMRVTGDINLDDLRLDQLQVSGISTFIGLSTFASGINVLGLGATTTTLDVSGFSTFSDTVKVDTLTENRVVIVGSGKTLEDDANFTYDGGQLKVGTGLSVTGLSTFVGVGTFISDLYVGGDLFIKENISLDTNLNILGIATVGTLDVTSDATIDGTLDGADGHKSLVVGTGLSVHGPSAGVAVTLAGAGGITTTGGDFYVGGDLFVTDNITLDTNLNVLGIVTAQGGIDVTGHTELDNLNVSGVTTTSGLLDINAGGQANTFKVEDLTDNRVVIAGTGGELEDDANLTFNGTQLSVGVDLDVDGHTELDNLNVSGVSTFTGAADFNGDIDVDGHTELDDVNISGILTAAILNVTGGGAESQTNLANLNVSGVSTFVGIGTFQSDLYVGGALYVSGSTLGDDIETRNISVSGLSTFTGAADFNGNVDIDGHTELDDVNVSGAITATTFSGDLTGNAGSATALETARTFEVTGDVVASAISFDGTGNVSLAATIQPNSVELSTDTTGDYVQTVSGTANEILVTGGTGEGSTPTIGFVANPTIGGNVNIGQDLTVTRDLQVTRNLNVDGNVTIGGTSATIFAETLRVTDPDLILGFRTDAGGNDVSNDTTANHGGVAIASTEGSPLITLVNPGAGETLPSTYKKIMWFKTGSFTGLNTDAWISNYAFGVGTTSMSAGTKFAVGNIEADFDDITAVRHINSTGVVTATALNVTGGGGAGSQTNLANLNVSGVSTFTGAIDANGDVDVDGHTELDNLNVSGVSTFAGAIDANGNLDVDGHTELDDVNVSGVSTFAGAIDANGNLDVDGHTELDNLNVSGVSTFTGAIDANGNLDVDGHTELDDLNVSGFSTFVGFATFSNDVQVAGVITATSFSGLGQIGVGSEGSFIGAGVTMIDFKSSNASNTIDLTAGIATVTVTTTGVSLGLAIALGG